MTALTWAIRLILFAVLVVFSIQNTGTTTLRLLPDQVWQAPLVIVLLLFFACGLALGALSLVGIIFRQRREISQLKRSVGGSPAGTRTDAPPVV